MLKDDVERLESSQSKAPSVIMKSLVEKLRHDLAEKEKKQKAMSVYLQGVAGGTLLQGYVESNSRVER